MNDLKSSKAVGRLIALIHRPIAVWMRSTPENVLKGELDSFNMECVPSILVVNTENGLRVVNMQDISFIEEKLQ